MPRPPSLWLPCAVSRRSIRIVRIVLVRLRSPHINPRLVVSRAVLVRDSPLALLVKRDALLHRAHKGATASRAGHAKRAVTVLARQELRVHRAHDLALVPLAEIVPRMLVVLRDPVDRADLVLGRAQAPIVADHPPDLTVRLLRRAIHIAVLARDRGALAFP